jgi:hypothetical protein
MMIQDEEKKWRAQDDARALAQAEEVKADESRFSAAKSAAAEMVAEEEKRLQGMRKVIGRKPSPSSSSSSSTKPNVNFAGKRRLFFTPAPPAPPAPPVSRTDSPIFKGGSFNVFKKI